MTDQELIRLSLAGIKIMPAEQQEHRSRKPREAHRLRQQRPRDTRRKRKQRRKPR